MLGGGVTEYILGGNPAKVCFLHYVLKTQNACMFVFISMWSFQVSLNYMMRSGFKGLTFRI